jgi:GT2 family glycosyltransferase
VVAFVDDDCEPRSDWVATLGDAAWRHPGCGLGGQVVNGLRENPYSETSQLIVTFLCRYYATGPTARFFTSNNLAFPRDALRQAGGFDVTYIRAAAEDRELCDRWVAGGRRLVAVPEAVVCHAHAMTAASFWRQHYGYGRGAWGYRRARAARSGAPVRVEPWTFYRDLLLCPIRTHGWRGVGLVGLVGLAQTANALGFLVEAARARWA